MYQRSPSFSWHVGIVLGVVLQESQIDRRTVHLHSYQWKNMKCGGRCQQCGLRDLKGLLQIVADVLPPGVIQDEPAAVSSGPSSSSRPSLTPDLHELIRNLATSVEVLSDRIGKVEEEKKKKDEKGEKEDRSRSRRGPKEPPYPPPSHRSSTPRPSTRRPPSPPQSPRASAQPFNRTFNPEALSQMELQEWVEGKVHDCLTWYGSESAAQNYEVGVRINIKVRGSVRWDTVKYPKDMSSWVKTSFARRRGTDQWYLVASRVPMS